MTTQRTGPSRTLGRSGDAWFAGRHPLILAAAVAFLVSCASNEATPTPPHASQSAAVEQSSSAMASTARTAPTAGTVPTTEPVPSLVPEQNQTTGRPTVTSSQATIDVKGPTLGANFTGVGDWHINSGGSLRHISVFTQGKSERVDISFGFHVTDGAHGVAYAGGRISPSGTYFSLGSDTCGGAVPASSAEEDGTCANLVFDPAATADASDPFDATLQIHIQLTCNGQDYPACRQTPRARSASPGKPVILDFTQSVILHGSTGCDPAPDAQPPCATGSSQPSAGSPLSPAQSAAPANSVPPADSSGRPNSPGPANRSGPASDPVPSG